MGQERLKMLPEGLREALRPLLQEVESLTEKIKECDARLSRSPGLSIRKVLVAAVSGVGTLIALTFVLTWKIKTIRKAGM